MWNGMLSWVQAKDTAVGCHPVVTYKWKGAIVGAHVLLTNMALVCCYRLWQLLAMLCRQSHSFLADGKRTWISPHCRLTSVLE